MSLIITSIVVVVLVVMFVTIYNNVIKTKNLVEENVSAIDTMFQNRYDLIPNLVEVVKQYASHEKELLE
jgi:LemA protein